VRGELNQSVQSIKGSIPHTKPGRSASQVTLVESQVFPIKVKSELSEMFFNQVQKQFLFWAVQI